MINRVTLVGNLGKDPEVRHFENGGSVARITVATNESYKDKEGNWQTQTEWHNVIAWRLNAERAEKELKKGSMVFVEGKLKTRSYKDANGIDKTITEVEASTLRSLDKRERSEYSNTAPLPEPNAHPAPQNYNSPGTNIPSTEPFNGDGISNDPSDDLPF
jgi:single-strand DNA-binding protein